jgi:hypothetical protein
LLCEGVFGTAPGVAWFGVENRLRFGKAPASPDFVSRHIEELLSAFSNGLRIPSSFLIRFFLLLSPGRDDVAWSPWWFTETLSTKEFQLFAYIVLAINEWIGGLPISDRINSLWSGALNEVVEVRCASEIGVAPDRECLETAKQVLRSLPDRLTLWAIGRADLVARDTEQWEDQLLLEEL